MHDLYIGLISGTSMDGIDAALVHFGDASLELVATLQYDYPATLREPLLHARADASLAQPNDIAELHEAVGLSFRDAALALLDAAGVAATEISAIGSHGQTIRHEPEADPPYSLQIGDPDLIAAGTGIRTYADFRRADIELGGQGAPLAPAFHEWLFRQAGIEQVVLNIGGISNITVLHADDTATTGFDTGPGNTLLDVWSYRHNGAPFDMDGQWSASGEVDPELLRRLLADPYFAASPPKSTGFEYFHLGWLEAAGLESVEPVNVQATLCELTARSVAEAVSGSAPQVSRVLVCGGGVHNSDLMRRLALAMPDIVIESTAVAGLDPDWVEAAAFAWLAMRAENGLPGNLPAVTGARQATVLGRRHEPA